MEIPLTLSLSSANLGEQHFLCARACKWDRHDKATGNRSVPVKEITYWRENYTCESKYLFAISDNSGFCYFKRSVNIWNILNENKLFH